MRSTCHPSRKYYSRGLCRPCWDRAYRLANADRLREYQRQWCRENSVRLYAERRAKREQDPEGVRAYYRAWRKQNSEKSCGYSRKWQIANPLRFAAMQRDWRGRNAGKVSAADRASKARRRASCEALTARPATARQRAALIATGELCLYCEAAQAVHVDHFIPIARWVEAALGGLLTAQQRADGPDHISNLVGACAACNLSKGARLPDVEWRGRKEKKA